MEDIGALPDVLLLLVFQQLINLDGLQAMRTLALVCRRWRQIFEKPADQAMIAHVAAHYGGPPAPRLPQQALITSSIAAAYSWHWHLPGESLTQLDLKISPAEFAVLPMWLGGALRQLVLRIDLEGCCTRCDMDALMSFLETHCAPPPGLTDLTILFEGEAQLKNIDDAVPLVEFDLASAWCQLTSLTFPKIVTNLVMSPFSCLTNLKAAALNWDFADMHSCLPNLKVLELDYTFDSWFDFSTVVTHPTLERFSFHGLDALRPAYENSDIPLVRDGLVHLPASSQLVYIGGMLKLDYDAKPDTTWSPIRLVNCHPDLFIIVHPYESLLKHMCE